MLVEKWMTRSVITVERDATLTTAAKILKEHGIRRLPVTQKGKVIGIVTDRDVKAASPSKATSLDMWELHFLLEKLKVEDVMTPRPITVQPDTTIERAAMIMMERKIGGLPVLDSTGSLVGILTEQDVFRALVEVTGVQLHKTRVSLRIPDEIGTLQPVADVCRRNKVRILSILVSYTKVPNGMREVIMRIDCPDVAALQRDLSAVSEDVVVQQD